MALNEKLNSRIREILTGVKNVEEKRMFSGVTFMVNGKMCISAGNDRLMCRIDPDLHEAVLKNTGVKPVLMKGREYKGFIYVKEDVLKNKKQLKYWVGLCLEFNQKAKASKKK